MNKQRFFCAGFVWLVLIGMAAGRANGQSDDGMEFMSPRFGTIRGWLRYDVDHSFEQGISDQTSDFGITSHELKIPLFRTGGENSELLFGAKVRVWDIDSDAVLPDSGQSFPDYLICPEITVAYKERIEGSKIWGTRITLGSPSDKPFGSIEEVSVNALVFLRVPAKNNDAWMFFLNYSNSRGFLEHIPLPGIAYVYKPSDNLLAYVGVPFVFVKYEPDDRWRLEASYMIPRGVHAKASYKFTEGWSVYGGFDWDSELFFRHDRHEDENRLFYYEKSIGGGVRWDINENIYVDFSAGYRFDRFFFEGEDYGDRSFNRINIGDGPYITLQAGIALE